MKMTTWKWGKRAGVALLAMCLSVTLVACGGGGGNPGAVTGGNGGATATAPTVSLTLVDSSGAAVTSLAGGQTATVKATVKTVTGAAAVGAIVQFAASQASLVEFTPAAASALTDEKGVAVITVKPASITSAGALSITATTVLDGKTGTASSNLAVGAAPLVVGTLSFVPPPTGPLPAFSALSIAIPLTSAGQAADTAPGLSMTSLCVGDGTASLVPGTLAKGVLTATYTNNGCTRGRDTITVTVGNSSQSITVDVTPANIGAILFTGTDMSGTSIVLKGSGGDGRTEAAQVKFRVVDQHNKGLPGVDVVFSATTYTGGLSVAPKRATTDANGDVTTMVSSGTIPTPVRVVAEATRNGVTLSGMSDTLTISTGLPIQKAMSLSASAFNIEGLSRDGEKTTLTVLLADQYGNPVSKGTAVNFVTEGGAVGSAAQGACLTDDNGGCSISLRSQEFRPANGRVTVLAYVQGIEDFVDENGDGQYSCTNYVDANGNKPAFYRPLVDTCVSGGEKFTDLADAFLDTGDAGVVTGVPTKKDSLDGVYEASKGDLPFPYNRTTYSSKGDGKWGMNYIRRSAEIVFSGSDATLIRQYCTSDGCRDWTTSDPDRSVIAGLAGSGCAASTLTFRLADRNNNPLPMGTDVGFADVDKVSPLTFMPAKVPSTNAIGGTLHSVTVKPDKDCSAGSFKVVVTTPSGVGTAFQFKSN